MNTLIVRTVIKFLIPLFFIFSIYLLFRGHHEPGGGFIGGLIAAIPFTFHAMIYGARETKKAFHINTMLLMSVGLLFSASSGVFSLLNGQPFMSSLWADFYLPIFGKPGTPILFDVGVYILVMGIVLRITLNMSEE